MCIRDRSIIEYSVGASSGSGFVNGTNSNGDLAKAAYFANSSAYPYILGCNIAFSTAYSSNPNKTITVSVCSVSGGNPGTVLSSKTVTMQQIMSNVSSGYFTSVMFSNPVNTNNAAFFIVVDYSNLYWNSDSLSIQSNLNGQTVPSAHGKNKAIIYGINLIQLIRGHLIFHLQYFLL